MKFQTILLLFVSILVTSGCAVPKSEYLLEKPLIFYSQETNKSEFLQQAATTAFLDALRRYKWEVRDLNREEGIVVAEACRRGVHCAEIIATVLADGSVSIIRTPGQVLTLDEGTMLKKWMNSLQREYNKNMRHIW